MNFKKLLIIFLCSFSLNAYAQGRSAIPRAGEGLHAFLIRNHLSISKYEKKFIALNKGKFGKNNSLLTGVSYLLPDTKNTSKVQNIGTTLYEPLFGKKYSRFKKQSNVLNGTVLYLVSGHGGPDPGAIGNYNGHVLHEDEYAYDVTLRLAKKLMENGAKVYIIIQDKNDGIRDNAVLSTGNRETCRGVQIPLSQVQRLKQRSDAVNNLYRKDTRAKYKKCIVLHVDSRSKSERLDVFFYHHSGSKSGKRLARNLANTFERKYNRHQPNRGFTGTVSARDLYVVRNIVPPVVFIELGNIQNTRDQQRFVNPNNRQALANWLYEGILRDFKNK